MSEHDEVTPAQAMAVNRLFWEEAVPVHLASAFYDVDGFRAGRCTLSPIERAELGEVAGLRVLHLQCHFGLDTLSLVRRGAVATGLDYAGAAVAAARRLSAETRLAAEFVEGNVYDAPALAGGGYDLVFTSWGVLGWLPDLPGWGQVVAAALRPGGRFYIVEGHPALHWFHDQPADVAPLRLTYGYRSAGPPERYDEPGSYADPDADIANTVEYAYSFNLSDVVSALAAAGMTIEFLREHETIAWPGLRLLEQGGDGLWRMPAGAPRLPLSFSLAARRG